MLHSKKLSKFTEISHGFFNKNGGVSRGIYKSLNCGVGSKDKKDDVKKNLKIVRRKISKKSKEIFLVKQTHGNKFLFLSKNTKVKNRSIAADAIITDKKDFPIAVLTADCVPILLFDKKRKMIAAIHAGWRGAFKGVISKVINFMLKKGCDRKDIIVAIGPSITQKNYNVKLDFKNKFIKKHKKNKIFFKNKKNFFLKPSSVTKDYSALKQENISYFNKVKINYTSKFNKI